MHLLIGLALWVAASVPLALIAGRLLGTSSHQRSLVEEIEVYLRRQVPSRRAWRHTGPLVVAVALAGAVLLGNAAVERLPAQVVADRHERPSSTRATAAPRDARTTSAGPASSGATHRRRAPRTTAPSSAARPPMTAAAAGSAVPAGAAARAGHATDATTSSTTSTTTTTSAEGQPGDGAADPRGTGDEHLSHGDRAATPSASGSSAASTTPTTPTTPTTSSTPAGSTTTSTSTTAPDRKG